jgi:hypothetical protein
MTCRVHASGKKRKRKEKGKEEAGRACAGPAAQSKRRTGRADAGCGRLGRFWPSSVRRPETFFLLFFFEFNLKLFTVLSINSVLRLQIEQNQLL